MFSTQDQISEATKASLAAQYALYSSMANKTFESTVKLINLNMTAVKATLEESAITTKQLLGAKDPQEFFTLIAAQTKPNFEKAIAYSNHVANIASDAQAEIAQVAEQQFNAMTQKMNQLAEDLARKAPNGSEGLFNMFKSAVNTANASYSQMAKAGKQAVETAEANVSSAVNQAAASAATTSAAATPSATTPGTKH